MQFFTFSYDKDIRAVITSYNYSFSSKSFLQNLALYSYNHILKNKNQHPRDLGLKFEKSNIEIRINIFEILCACMCMCASFQAKQIALTFTAQICPKMDLRSEIQKNNIGIRITIVKMPCVPILRKSGQLWLIRSKFSQKWILG